MLGRRSDWSVDADTSWTARRVGSTNFDQRGPRKTPVELSLDPGWTCPRPRLNLPWTPIEPAWTPVEPTLDPDSTCPGPQLKLSSTQLKKLNCSWRSSTTAEEVQLTWKSSTAAEEAQMQLKMFNSAKEAQLQLKKSNSVEKAQLQLKKLNCSWRSSTAFQQEHSLFLNPNNSHTQSIQGILVFEIAFEYRGLIFSKHQPSFWTPLIVRWFLYSS
jgi:hypothetical protein